MGIYHGFPFNLRINQGFLPQYENQSLIHSLYGNQSWSLNLLENQPWMSRLYENRPWTPDSTRKSTLDSQPQWESTLNSHPHLGKDQPSMWILKLDSHTANGLWLFTHLLWRLIEDDNQRRELFFNIRWTTEHDGLTVYGNEVSISVNHENKFQRTNMMMNMTMEKDSYIRFVPSLPQDRQDTAGHKRDVQIYSKKLSIF